MNAQNFYKPAYISDAQVHYVATLLRKHHAVTSRAEFRARYDKYADFSAIDGIGPKRALVLTWLLGQPDDVWTELTGLAA